MLKSLVCAVLALCTAAPHAETWHFAYQGFHDSATGSFDGTRLLTGSFTGADGDHDGIVGRGEITALVLGGMDYVACQGDSNEYYHCGTDAFSYTPGGALYFSAGVWGSDPEGWVGSGHTYIAGDREYEYRFHLDEWEDHTYRWTPQTTFAISPAPEPGAWALLPPGLAILRLAAARRRRR
jgi:hypothetical protein